MDDLLSRHTRMPIHRVTDGIRLVADTGSPPAAPVITSPATGLQLAGGTVTVSGSSEPYVFMQLRRSGFVVASVTPGADGLFTAADIPLLEGMPLLPRRRTVSVAVPIPILLK